MSGELLVVYGALYERLTMIKGGVGYLTLWKVNDICTRVLPG